MRVAPCLRSTVLIVTVNAAKAWLRIGASGRRMVLIHRRRSMEVLTPGITRRQCLSTSSTLGAHRLEAICQALQAS